MNGLQVELIPQIGARLLGLGMSAVFKGSHGLRRMAEGFIWGEPHRGCGHSCHGGCMDVHHHYRYHCQPRCYDCRR